MDLQSIANRVEIDALRNEYTDAGFKREWDRFASLFTADGVWRMPHINAEFVGRDQIRAGVERLQEMWEFFVQNTHPGVIVVDGDTATGRVFVAELGRMLNGSSHRNNGVYHDRYERTPQGWRFAEREYEVLYADTSPVFGSPLRQDAGRGR
jgi:ketosteroid isomerase-like protein